MTLRLIYLIIPILLFVQVAVSQDFSTTKTCYSDKPLDKENVFTKMLHKPYFKGGNDSLILYLMTHINFQKVRSDFAQKNRTYSDTARVKFIVSKYGSLSDVHVTLTKTQVLADEIIRVLKQSACNWVAGGTERLLNGWLQFDIHYSIERRFNEMAIKIKIKEYEFATDN